MLKLFFLHCCFGFRIAVGTLALFFSVTVGRKTFRVGTDPFTFVELILDYWNVYNKSNYIVYQIFKLIINQYEEYCNTKSSNVDSNIFVLFENEIQNFSKKSKSYDNFDRNLLSCFGKVEGLLWVLKVTFNINRQNTI